MVRLQKDLGFQSFLQLAKGLGRRPVTGVTVQMETPVIYFHSATALRAKVTVGFEGGTISQWFPERSGGQILPEPPRSADGKPPPPDAWLFDFSPPRRGQIEWDVEVLSPAESRAAVIFKPSDSVNWLRARIPEANVVRSASGELENYLFYRGIGNFPPGLRLTVSADETLHAENRTPEKIPYLLVFERRGGVVLWHAAAGIDSGGSLQIPESALVGTASGKFPEEIYRSIRDALAATGLLQSEADAMVQTWWTSYFETEGLRVFWILPRTETDRILPLAISPAPEKVVRVLVGRSEILRPAKEAELLELAARQGNDAAPWLQLVATDRFGSAFRHRVEALKSAQTARP